MAKDDPSGKENEIELKPDGWAQFERAVDAAVKSGPKHRPSKKHVDGARGVAKRDK